MWLHCDGVFAALITDAAPAPAEAATAMTPPPVLAAAPDSLHGIDLPVIDCSGLHYDAARHAIDALAPGKTLVDPATFRS